MEQIQYNSVIAHTEETIMQIYNVKVQQKLYDSKANDNKKGIMLKA